MVLIEKVPTKKRPSAKSKSVALNGDKSRRTAPAVTGSPTTESTNPPLLDQLSERFDSLCSSYDHFIIPDSSKSDEFKELTKSLYEYGQKAMKTVDPAITSRNRSQAFKPLSSLFVKGFDNEQIWQQLDVFNKPFLDNLVHEVSNLSSRRALLTLNIETNEKLKATDTSEKRTSKSILKDETSIAKESKKEKSKKVKFSFAEEGLHSTVDSGEKNETSERQAQQEMVDFFNLDEMEAFLDAEDRKEMNDPTTDKPGVEDDIDYFADMPSDSDEEDDGGENGVMYLDFFDPPPLKVDTNNLTGTNEKVQDDEDADEELDEGDDDELDTRDFDEEEGNDLEMDDSADSGHILGAASDSDKEASDTGGSGNNFDIITQKLKALANENLNSAELEENDMDKSEFEKSQIMLRKKIAKAERELLHPSNLHWQMAGETTGDVRPENSLLEEHLQFDHVSKPAPMITDQTTLTLEGLIKQRIKDAAFDDVERKEKPNEQPFEFRRRIMLESEKSKVGLAEVYEQEYLKKQQQLKEQEGGSSSFAAAGEVEETETRKEIRRLMRGLFRKLDSLSAFHYTPRPPEPEVKIINNLPAISVEEVTPDTVSDMKLLAPEEVFSTRGKKVLQAKDERTSTDKKRARRIKKKKQSIKQQMMERKTKARAGKANKAEIEKLKRGKKTEQNAGFDKKALSSSTKFFERLQETKETSKVEKRKKTKSNDTSLAKKLKL